MRGATATFNPTLSTTRATTTATPIIAATYERVSTRDQGRHGFSLGAQHQSLEEFARLQGWVLPEHLRFRDGEDADASGAAWDLPGITAVLDAARRREFQVLAVPDLDRFARSLTKGLVLEEQLKTYGVRVVYQRVPVDDSPEGRLLKHQLFSFAEFEREKTTLRTTMGRRMKAQLGQVVGGGGRPPFGYRFVYALRDDRRRIYGIEPDPITAPIARRILGVGRVTVSLRKSIMRSLSGGAGRAAPTVSRRAAGSAGRRADRRALRGRRSRSPPRRT